MDLYYQLNDRPPLAKCLILGLQHLLAALPGIIDALLVIAAGGILVTAGLLPKLGALIASSSFRRL